MRLVLVLLLSAAFAGCVTDAPVEPSLPDTVSDAVYEILPVEELFVTASDGTRLHQAVYRPDTEEPVPVFINFSPYWGDSAELMGDNFGQYMIQEYVPRGYAVVLSAVRGTGHSAGCFEVASDREAMDLHEVVDHFANVGWSNGNVAAGGKSYDSTTQNGMIAKFPHPALKGIFHVSGITDMYRYNYVGGVPYSNGLTFTPRYATEYSQDGAHPDGEPYNVVDMACPEMAEHFVSGTGSAADGLKDDYWIERDWTRYIGDSEWNGSIFFVHGFQDWNVKPDHILPWIDNLPEQIRVKGWLHQDTYNNGHVYPMRADWNDTMLAWLDTELKGKDLGFWDGPAWDVEATDGMWREMEDWPPVAVDAPVEFSSATGGAVSTLEVQVDLEGLANETGFTHITGSPVVRVTPLYVNEDPVAVATWRLNGEWVGEAVLRVIYRDGLDAPQPVVPGSIDTIDLVAYPMDIVVGPGDELTVTVGGEPRHSIVTAHQQTGMLYGESLGVTLPVGDADARADQPEAIDCFAC